MHFLVSFSGGSLFHGIFCLVDSLFPSLSTDVCYPAQLACAHWILALFVCPSVIVFVLSDLFPSRDGQGSRGEVCSMLAPDVGDSGPGDQ